jgi:predicted ATPase/class 3 adenylate cyclase
VPGLPTGIVTFLFTDIEGSTALLQHLGDQRYAAALAEHREILRAAFQAEGGQEVDTQGDAFLIAFGSARDAVASATAAQRAINAHPWPEGTPIRVRMGLHTGEPVLSGHGYVGLDVHRAARIMAAGYGGQILLSQATRDAIEQSLPEDLKVRDLGEHRLKDLTRPEHIFQVVSPNLPLDFPALKTLDIISNNLPIQLTTFIGREREIEEVKRLLSNARLLTLMGTGGAGKTRLSIQVAADLIDQFQKGAWLVELAPLSDPALVVQAVASIFQVREAAGRSLLDLLVDYLQAKSLLLVLDNCEHLVEACAQLAGALLRACPNLKILATSRAALGIAGEVTYRVPPLSRPDPKRAQSLDQLTQFESVQLFVERGVHSQPKFALTAANAKAVAHICHRLDGIPLAIELAAARVRVLSVDQIAARLDDRFRLLTGGSRTGLPHHQTLRAAMDWGYDLLSEEERALMRRLTVFAGGFSLEAIEAVCADDGVDVFAILDLLTSLVDKSFVVAEGMDGDIRYHLLETIRQYCREKLQASGEASGVHGRHLAWYLDFAEQAEPKLQGPDQLGSLSALEMEHDNLRTALEWAKTEESGAEAGLRLAGALYRFWAIRGYLSEGREWLEGAEGRSEGASSARAKAIYGAAVLAFAQGDYGRSADLCERSLTLYRELGDKLGIALSQNIQAFLNRNRGEHGRAVALLENSLTLCRELNHPWALAETLYVLALTVRRQGDYERAKALLEESLVLWRQTGDKWGLTRTLGSLGVVARLQGDYARSRALHEESLALARESGHKFEIAEALLTLGTVAQNQGDYARAIGLYEECLILSRESGDKLRVGVSLLNLGNVRHYQGDQAQAKELVEEAKTVLAAVGAKQQTAVCLSTLGSVALAQGEVERAIALFRESLTLYRALGDKRGTAELLECFASVGAAVKEGERAARLFGAADELRERIRAPLPLSDRPAYDRSMAAARGLLPEAAFAMAYDQGRKLPLEEAINEAMTVERPAERGV